MFDALFGGEAVLPRDEGDVLGRRWGWVPQLATVAGVALIGAAIADAASRNGRDWAYVLFALSLMVAFVPLSARILWPSVSRYERIVLVLIAGVTLLVVRLIHEPINFLDHDAFLHWATSLDILDEQRFFKPNPLLPISPLYPGLEIVTTALSNLSGLSVFDASRLVVFVTRMVFVLGLFLVYERITGSPRIAAIGTLVYMGCATFVYFDAMFSYGALALTFLILLLLAHVRELADDWRTTAVLVAPLGAALAITHHLTGYIAGGIFAALAAMEWIRSGWTISTRRCVATAVLTLGFVASWSWYVGNPGESYLRPVFDNAIQEAVRFLTFAGGRSPFEAEDGQLLPAWQRYITIASVILVCLALATSFFRSLAAGGIRVEEIWKRPLQSMLRWQNSALVLLTLLTLAYPFSIILRMTRAGWEVGSRITPFAYLGVGIVVSIGIVAFWLRDTRSMTRFAAMAGTCALCVAAGVVSGGGPHALGSSRFRVSGDSASIEPLGISAAQWTAEWLGPGHRFYADRTNRLLLATYGRQQVVTTLYDMIDLEPLVFGTKVGAPERNALRETDLDFLALDFRITQELPVVGWYFDPGPTYEEPPLPEVMLKFSNLDGADRVFDNGYISIVDVRKYRDGR